MSSIQTPVTSEALFGSAARGDHDEISDRDYLVVDDDCTARLSRKLCLQKKGFSVADYSFQRLEKLLQTQTLFGVHLAREARITHDPSLKLGTLLARHREKSVSAQDLDDSLDLMTPLAAIPDTPRGRAWALDVLAVAFRNTSIVSLARDGDYVFSSQGILRELRRRDRIASSDLGTVAELRVFKRRFRSHTSFGVTRSTVDASLRAITRALKVEFDVRFQRRGRPVFTTARSVYARMRIAEAELISMETVPLGSDEARFARARLQRAVRNPHAYAWSFGESQRRAYQDLALIRRYL